MKQYPSLVKVSTLISGNTNVSTSIDTPAGKKWVPARSLGYPSFRSRVSLAWMVFRGKADALVWEGQ